SSDVVAKIGVKGLTKNGFISNRAEKVDRFGPVLNFLGSHLVLSIVKIEFPHSFWLSEFLNSLRTQDTPLPPFTSKAWPKFVAQRYRPARGRGRAGIDERQLRSLRRRPHSPAHRSYLEFL